MLHSNPPAVTFLGSGDAFGDGGRNQACILVATDRFSLLLDCGATSLGAMKRFGIDPGEVDAVLISHYHADHFGGIPFLILDGQFTRRSRPLAIIGPGDVTGRVAAMMEVAFPGSSGVDQLYARTFHGLRAGDELDLGEVSVRAFPAAHTPGSEAVSLRLSVGDRSIAYTGDTQWSEAIPELARGADLLICESYTWERRIPYHLDHRSLVEHRAELSCRRTVLTHFGPDALAHLTEADEEIAEDGLRLAW